jgi:carbonic anhydrase
VVTDAWQRGQSVVVHGWVYGLDNGLLQDMRITVASSEEMAGAYAQALQALHQRWIARSRAL